MLLLDFWRQLEDAIAYFFAGLEVRPTLEGQIRARRRIAVHQRHPRVFLERVGHAAVGVTHPDAQLVIAEDLGAAPQRQVRSALLVGIGNDHRRIVGQSGIDDAFDKLWNSIGNRRRRTSLVHLLDMADLVLVVEGEGKGARRQQAATDVGRDGQGPIGVPDWIRPWRRAVDAGHDPEPANHLECVGVALESFVAVAPHVGADGIQLYVRSEMPRGVFRGRHLACAQGLQIGFRDRFPRIDGGGNPMARFAHSRCSVCIAQESQDSFA